MRVLVLAHRWLGVALCLLFAMWFASGIALHFVPYPDFDQAERLSGEAPLAVAPGCCVSVATALRSAGVEAADVRRVRLAMLDDRPVLHLLTWSGVATSVHADDGTPVVVDAVLASRIAGRFPGAHAPTMLDLVDYDQWSVHHKWNPWRPFHRIRLNDGADTILYVSARTGEVVRDTNRLERTIGWVGAVPHWLYPTALRRLPSTWRQTVIWISAAGIVSALSGSVLGVLRLRWRRGRPQSPFHRWQFWHHMVGLGVALFLITWIVSGFLSVNPGRWFSEAGLTRVQAEAHAGGAFDADAFPFRLHPAALLRFLTPDDAREIDLVRIAGEPLYRVRGRTQHLFRADEAATPVTEAQIQVLLARGASRVVPGVALRNTRLLDHADSYHYTRDGTPPGRLLRFEFADGTWVQSDPASGEVVDVLDPSRRAYRWWFDALHTLDVPVLAARPGLRSIVIVVLCGAGFAFSVTGVVLGWRRLVRR